MTPVVLATVAAGALDVYVRSAAGGVDQVGRLVVGEDSDPVRLTELLSDLDDSLGWSSRNGTTVGPARRVAPVERRPLGPSAAAERPSGDAIRDRYVERFRAASPEPLSIQDLGGESARHHVRRLVRDGVLVDRDDRTTASGGALYSLIEDAPPRFRRRPRSERATSEEMERRFAAALAVLGDGVERTVPEIAAALGLPRSQEGGLRSRLGRLAESGEVVRRATGILPTGVPTYAFSLP